MNKQIFTPIALALLAASTAATEAQDNSKTCTALVMSGGGSNLVWEAGVIWGFVHYGDPTEFAYDVVTGVSAGAINTAAFAGWAVGDEVKQTEWLSQTLLDMTSEDIWVNWTGGVLTGLFKQGLFNDAPALEFLNGILSSFPGFSDRLVQVMTVDANTGEEIQYNEKNTAWGDFAQAALASSSVPGIFPPQAFEGHMLIDGMTAWNTNVEDAIQRCKEITTDESKITVDVLICGYTDITAQEEKDGNTIDNWFRARSIGSYLTSGNSIDASQKAHPKVNIRHHVEERNGYSGLKEINFDGDTTWELQVQGRADACSALQSTGMLVDDSCLTSSLNESTRKTASESAATAMPESFLQ